MYLLSRIGLTIENGGNTLCHCMYLLLRPWHTIENIRNTLCLCNYLLSRPVCNIKYDIIVLSLYLFAFKACAQC